VTHAWKTSQSILQISLTAGRPGYRNGRRASLGRHRKFSRSGARSYDESILPGPAPLMRTSRLLGLWTLAPEFCALPCEAAPSSVPTNCGWRATCRSAANDTDRRFRGYLPSEAFWRSRDQFAFTSRRWGLPHVPLSRSEALDHELDEASNLGGNPAVRQVDDV
jgi:hypothetical protein